VLAVGGIAGTGRGAEGGTDTLIEDRPNRSPPINSATSAAPSVMPMTIGESFIGGNLFSCAGFDKAAKRPELRLGYSNNFLTSAWLHGR
jgi:hypothetical protein